MIKYLFNVILYLHIPRDSNKFIQGHSSSRSENEKKIKFKY